MERLNMAIRTILIVEAAHAVKLGIVAAQMGYPQAFDEGRRCCAIDPGATPETPPTHYLCDDATMSSENEQRFRLMAAGEYLPQVVWADIPEITETSANAAAAALTVLSAAGAGVGSAQITDLMASVGLQFVPDIEI